MKALALITARGGSKGIVGKNIKPLAGKPLIHYSIEFARCILPDENICISTDSQEIKEIAEQTGLKVPFLRPAALATDTATSRDVILHALEMVCQDKSKTFDVLILLQPTSPFRKVADAKSMIQQFNTSLDMVVSVSKAKENPYYSLFEEDESGFLKLSKSGQFTRRQDVPDVYAFNGSLYVINVDSIKARSFSDFKRTKKFVMDDIHSIDIDTHFDWMLAEGIIRENIWTSF